MVINTLKKFAIILISVASIAWIDPSYDKTKEGNKLYFDGKYDEAISKYVDAQMDSPESPALDFNIADVQYKTEKYDEAILAYEKVIKNTRNIELEAKANFNIGNSLYRQGKLKEALNMYKRTVELTDELVESNSTGVEADELREDAKFNHEFVEKKIKEMLSKEKDRQEKQEEDKQKEDKDDQEKKEETKGNGQEQQDQNQGEEKQQDDGEKSEQENGQEKDKEKEQNQQNEGEEKQDQQESENKDSNEGKENSQNEQAMDTQNKLEKHPETGMTEEEASRLLDAIQQNEENNKINIQLEYTKGSYIDKDW